MAASEFRQEARERLNGHWGLAVGTTFVAAVLGAANAGPSTGFRVNSDDIKTALGDDYYYFADSVKHTFEASPGLLAVVVTFFAIISAWSIAAFILGGATHVGLCAFNRKLYLNQNAEFKDLFTHYDIFGKAFVTNLLMGIFIGLWTLLLIVPGIIAGFAYSMTFYILDENPGMGAMEAIKASKELMKGHKWELFCLYFSFIGWALLAGLTLGIGGLFLNPYVYQSQYAFYYRISRERLSQNAQAVN